MKKFSETSQKERRRNNEKELQSKKNDPDVLQNINSRKGKRLKTKQENDHSSGGVRDLSNKSMG